MVERIAGHESREASASIDDARPARWRAVVREASLILLL